MRIGLVGVGRIGVFHASTLRGLPGVDSLIITDADLGRAREVAGQTGAQAAESVAELLGAGIDALVIAATTGAHPELIKRGVQAGVPVFRDCAVHDFDAVRWVSGREVVQVYATGANRGEEFFRAAGDVDTACAALRMDALEAFYVAEACELSRHRQQPVLVAEVRQ